MAGERRKKGNIVDKGWADAIAFLRYLFRLQSAPAVLLFLLQRQTIRIPRISHAHGKGQSDQNSRIPPQPTYTDQGLQELQIEYE